jgi:hypothetical protein
MKKVAVAAIAVAGLLSTSSIASAQFCVVGIMIKGIYVSANEHRELTQKEAMTCGFVVDEDERKVLIAKGKKEARAKKH